MKRYGVALTAEVHRQAKDHLIREDGQEDLCFGLWYPSQGRERQTALISQIILPEKGERKVHGNATFSAAYFQRALGIAMKKGAGVAFMHSHPSPGWQAMSTDDIRAEHGHAAATKGATGLSLVGMTMGSDGSWSARVWEKKAPRRYERLWCESVRVIGDELKVTFNDELIPLLKFRKNLERTVSAWGPGKQGTLARLRIGVIGAGSVGSIIAEALARMGIKHVKILDFDTVEIVNLDRLLHATERDARRKRAKVRVLAKALRKSATAERFCVEPTEWSVVEEEGFREALDCDLLFGCVDRPWPRSVLNFIAYAHLIPVVDGGIKVQRKPDRSIRGADWKAHIVGPGRICLECLGQYDPGLVQMEREGSLDDSRYIETLPEDHSAKTNENVFAFSLSTASLQVLQMLSMVISPSGVSYIGEQNYHFVTGTLDTDRGKCKDLCFYPSFIARGDHVGLTVTGKHAKAEAQRKLRRWWWELCQTVSGVPIYLLFACPLLSFTT
jgi:hypothetical protein